jgi:mRNA-degrading endonuclease RelE of RelBE toxin-antitoxin system
MIPVRIQDEVLDYLRQLSPKPRQAMRLAIKRLAKEEGDIKPLTDELEGFYRLRVGSHRVVFEYEIIDERRVITCVYAGPRKWIYEVFHSRLREG